MEVEKVRWEQGSGCFIFGDYTERGDNQMVLFGILRHADGIFVGAGLITFEERRARSGNAAQAMHNGCYVGQITI